MFSKALQKLAKNGNVAAPVKVAPGGQPKIDTAPGQGSASNPAVPPSSAPGGQPNIDTAPGQGAKGNPAVPPSTVPGGQPSVGTAPEGGARGKGQEGKAELTKGAAFRAGVVKAAQEAYEEASFAEFLDAVDESGLDPSLVEAVLVAEAAGGKVELEGEMAEKMASLREKVALSPHTKANLAALGFMGAAGGLGYHMGKNQAARGEKHTLGAKQIASALLLPGGLAYQGGRALAHSNASAAKAKAKANKKD